MAGYSYKEVVYRDDFCKAIKPCMESCGMSEKDYEGDANYNGDAWAVTAFLLEKKDADHAAFVAQVREVAKGMLCAPDCDSRRPGHMVGGISFDANVPPKAREVKHKCTCPRGKLLALCEVK